MADIVQTMGFDIGDSVSKVQTLGTALGSLANSFTASAAAMKQWNNEAGTMSKLASIGDKVNRLTNQYNALAKAQAKLGAGPTAAAGPSSASLQTQLGLIKQLTGAWGSIPKTNPMAQQFAQVQASAASFATRMKMSSVEVASAFTLMGSGGSASVRALGQQFATMSAMSAQAMGQIKERATGISVALGSMVKYQIFSQMIGMISSFVAKLKEGVTAAADFSRQMGMIQTVAKGAPMGKMEQQLTDMSRTYGSTLSDNTAAYYLTLQNQVGDAAQSMQVLNEAQKIAAITGSPLSNVVDTLTVSLNGFKLKAKDAGDVSGKLFKAMEIGRFQFSDMTDTMGRVDGMASDLGVTMSQILGPIATMTRQGVRFDTAVTQMRAVISQMLKPTKELKKLYENWGVSGVEEAISKFGGFLPMLKATEDSFGGNSSAMAKAFTNLRAFTGMMGMLGKNYEQSANDTKQIEEANSSLTDSLYKTFSLTAGQQYKVLLNDIAVNFMEIGQLLLPLAAAAARFFGILTASPVATVLAMATAIGAITSALAGAIVAYKAAKAAAAAFALAQTTASALAGGGAAGAAAAAAITPPIVTGMKTAAALSAAAFTGAFIVGLGIGLAGVSLQKWLWPSETAKADAAALAEKAKRQGEITWEQDRLAKLEENAQKEIDIRKKTADAIIGILTQKQKLQTKIADDINANEKASLKILGDTLDNAVNIQKKKVDKLFSMSVGEGQDALVKSLGDAQTNAKNKEFDFQNKYEEPNKARAAAKELMHSDRLRYDALSKLRDANTKEEFDAIRSQLDSADQYAQKAGSSAGALGDQTFEKRAAKSSVTIAKDKASIAKAELDYSKRAQKEAIASYPEQLKLLSKMAAVRARMDDELVTKGKSSEQIKEDRKSFEADSKELTALMTEAGKGTSGNAIIQKYTEQLAAMAGQMPALETQVKLVWAESEAAFQKSIEGLNPEILVRFKVDPRDPIGSLIQGTQDKTADLEVQLMNQASNKSKLDAANKTLSERAALGAGAFANATPFQGKDLTEVQQAYNNLLIVANQLASTPITPENLAAKRMELQTLITLYKQYNDEKAKETLSQAGQGALTYKPLQGNPAVAAGIGGTIKSTQQDLAVLSQVDFTGTETKLANLSQDLALIKQQAKVDLQFNVLGVDGVKVAADGVKLSFDSVVTALTTAAPDMGTFATGLASCVSPAASLASSLASAATAAAQIVIPAIPTGPGSAMGGYQRFARGGRAQGTDTIPAMLSKGEYVMNAKSTRRNFSQLVAMNSGVKPVYRQDGGSVTNVGDINVSVNGSSTSKQSARDIATALRREMRRGTARL
jgi:TP901 family phage tail tape measure protein